MLVLRYHIPHEQHKFPKIPIFFSGLFKKKKKDDTFDKAAIEKTDDFLTKIELEELAKIKESIRTLKSTYKNSKITLREALSGLSPSDSIQKLLE